MQKAVCSALVRASAGVPLGGMLPKALWSPWCISSKDPAGNRILEQHAQGGQTSQARLLARSSLVLWLCAASCNLMWLLNCSVSPAREGRNPGSPPAHHGTGHTAVLLLCPSPVEFIHNPLI